MRALQHLQQLCRTSHPEVHLVRTVENVQYRASNGASEERHALDGDYKPHVTSELRVALDTDGDDKLQQYIEKNIHEGEIQQIFMNAFMGNAHKQRLSEM